MELIAHRGTAREYPENTVPAFLQALTLGADGVELDVHGSQDGVVVVHHDAAPRPSTPGAQVRPFAAMTATQVREVRLADGIGIPTLDEVLDAIGARGNVYIEIKGRGIERQVMDCISRSRTRCAVHSFDHRIVRAVREMAPDMRVGVLTASYLLDPEGTLRAAGAQDYWQQVELCDRSLVARIHDAGGRVIAWTINEPVGARALRALGVDALCTDDIVGLRAALA